jgi:hypothetical protein
MQDVLSGADLFNSIMMERQTDSRLILLLESEEDCAVVDLHLDDSIAGSIPGYGKPSVLEAAELFHAEGVRDVLPFVDSDFDRILGVSSSYSPNVESTEFYDLEMDILHACPMIIEGMILNFSDKSSREMHLVSLGMTAVEVVMHISLRIGVLRFQSVRDGLGLNMKGFPAEFAVDGFRDGNLEVSVLDIARKRSQSSAGPVPSPSDLTSEIAIVDHMVIYNGHDVFSVISRLLGMIWNRITISSKYLESSARAAVGCDCFRRLKLYSVITAWGQSLGKTPLHC